MPLDAPSDMRTDNPNVGPWNIRRGIKKATNLEANMFRKECGLLWGYNEVRYGSLCTMSNLLDLILVTLSSRDVLRDGSTSLTVELAETRNNA